MLGRATVLALLAPAFAAAEGTDVLTRGQALAEALVKNPELRAARAQLGFPEAEVLEASRLLIANPELEGGLSTDRLFKAEGEGTLEVALAQEFEIGGQRGLRIGRAEKRLGEAQARLRALELRVARDASDAFFALWRAERLRDLARSTRELNEALSKAAGSRFEAGDIAELEANTVEVDLARAVAADSAAEAEAVRVRAQLASLLGRPAAALLATADEPLLPPPAVEEALVAGAKERRPELEAARLAVEAAEAEVELRGREIIPNLSLALAYEREDQSIDGPLPGGLGEVAFDDRDHIFGVRLSIPIPVWDRRQAERRSATAGAEVARIESDATGRLVEIEVRTARAAVERARAAVLAFDAALPKVSRNLELLQRAYEVGEIGLSDLLLAKDRAFATQREAIEARAGYWVATAELIRASATMETNR